MAWVLIEARMKLSFFIHRCSVEGYFVVVVVVVSVVQLQFYPSLSFFQRKSQQTKKKHVCLHKIHARVQMIVRVGVDTMNAVGAHLCVHYSITFSN